MDAGLVLLLREHRRIEVSSDIHVNSDVGVTPTTVSGSDPNLKVNIKTLKEKVKTKLKVKL